MGVAAMGTVRLWISVVGTVFLCLSPAHGQQQPATTSAFSACADFAKDDQGASWALEDCIGVWEDFSSTLPRWLHRRLPHVDTWGETGADLRRAGAPCLVASEPTQDGVGSSTVRHLASWIFSVQMDCDWMTPEFARMSWDKGNGTAMYCHRTATSEEMVKSKPDASREEREAMRRCSAVDWVSYFNFAGASVKKPTDVKMKVVQPSEFSAEAISRVKEELKRVGPLNQYSDRLVFHFPPSFSSHLLVNTASWDDSKRSVARRVLQQARDNFYVHPRPWYDENPKCAFDEGRLHFAIHARMGDRRQFLEENNEYFDLLDLIMGTITNEVVNKGLARPLFHVFSETLMPCPSEETGLFDEFPTWLIGLDQIPPCVNFPIPDDCPEKEATGFCAPKRDGIFKVVGKDLMLHVGSDVQNALNCMIHADGILMGCSTFGQVAGLLTKGISMFSTQCGGMNTPAQYKTIPPMAVAERGHLWVPISGSWRDPVLSSASLFRNALNDLVAQKGTV